MKNWIIKQSKAVKISIIVVASVAVLASAYYAGAFITKKNALKSAQLNKEAAEASLANKKEMQPENVETTQQDEQNTGQQENIETVAAPVSTANTEKESISAKEEADKAAADAKAKADAKAVADAKAKADKAEAAAKAKAEADAKAVADAKASVKTKTAIWNINCSPSNTAEDTAYYRKQGLDYIQKLRDEGEKIIEVREEKCRFIIVMEDNPN